jgi:hypothetical protein
MTDPARGSIQKPFNTLMPGGITECEFEFEFEYVRNIILGYSFNIRMHADFFFFCEGDKSVVQ